MSRLLRFLLSIHEYIFEFGRAVFYYLLSVIALIVISISVWLIILELIGKAS